MRKRSDLFRIRILVAVIFLSFGLVLYKLFVLSYLEHGRYVRTAETQTAAGVALPRGNVYFTDKLGNRILAAGNKKFPVIAVTASKIPLGDAERVAAALSTRANGDKDDILKLIQSRSDYIRPVGKRLTSEQAKEVKELAIEGVSVTQEVDRFYPNQHLASDVLGFFGYSGAERSGQYGIEAYYENELSGRRSGLRSLFSKNTLSTLLGFIKRREQPQQAPSDEPKEVLLTIDKNIQAFAEDALDRVLKKWGASGGNIIVQEPISGKLLALADRPNFNPNTYSTYTSEMFLNGTVQQIFEPGSSFKPITMAAGLDLGKITPQTTYEDKGRLAIAGYEIKNFDEKAHGIQTMTQVLEKSLNTGTMYVQSVIGEDSFLNYVINLGFGQRTGIDLPGEVNGNVANLYTGRKINFLTASFGQGIAVTPVQLITAYSAIANGGKLMRPYVVQSVISSQGQEVKTEPEIVGIPLSEKTTGKLKAMLVAVVDNGFDKARVRGYDIAAKTGTAQIPDERGGYQEGQFIHNIVGFAPAYEPRFVVMIKMDKPQGIKFAADSLSPSLKEMMEFLINYYNVPPTR